MLTLHPAAFMETDNCGGRRYVRGQPSRESGPMLPKEINEIKPKEPELKEHFGNEPLTDSQKINEFIHFIGSDSKRAKQFMNRVWYPSNEQKEQIDLSSEQFNKLRNILYIEGNKVPRTGVVFSGIFFVILILIIISLIVK